MAMCGMWYVVSLCGKWIYMKEGQQANHIIQQDSKMRSVAKSLTI